MEEARTEPELALFTFDEDAELGKHSLATNQEE
jgi:hypothetical protein